ncbi:MAG TPA: hypothetical protein VGG28_22930 [Kofleriaceae bacterium]
MKRWWWAWLGAVIFGVIGYAVGTVMVGDAIGHSGHRGAARFVGMCGALGGFAGYFVTARLTRGKRLARDGFTLSYRPLPPTATSYRENATLTVADVLAGLSKLGYEPRAEACDDFGTRRGSIDATAPLQGASVAISDAGVRGWIRLALAPFDDNRQRAFGLVEIWSSRGESAQELALFTLRVLDGFVAELVAARDTSQLSPDPIAMVTAGLADRPAHRAR